MLGYKAIISFEGILGEIKQIELDLKSETDEGAKAEGLTLWVKRRRWNRWWRKMQSVKVIKEVGSFG